MKKLFTSIIFFLVCVFSINVHAQVSRSNTKSSVPYRANYQRISASTDSYNTFEIRYGTLWAWGNNVYGQLGDGTIINKTVPLQIGNDQNWIRICTGVKHSYGLKSDGKLWWHGEGTI